MPLVLVIAGLIALYIGAEGLVRGSSSIALRLGVSSLLVGLTIVAFGTSAPELCVSVLAGLKQKGAVATGNVIGSNIFNIAVILGISALLRPVRIHQNLVRRDIPIMFGVALIAVLLVYFGWLGRISGIALCTALIIYVIICIRWARRESPRNQDAFRAALEPSLRGWSIDAIRIGGGLLLLGFGSQWFVSGSVSLARSLGVSEAVIGLTLVAAGTSLPELATSLVAAWKHQPDIAVGNVVGSNIFNVLGVLGAASLVSPLNASAITIPDLITLVVISLVLLPFAFTGFVLSRREGGVLIGMYLVYLCWLWLHL